MRILCGFVANWGSVPVTCESQCRSLPQRLGWHRSCPSSLRLNTRGLPGDRYRGTKAPTIGPLWCPSGPLHGDDALEAGRAGTRRHLRSPPVAVSHRYGVLIPPLAGAMAARATAASRVASRPGRAAPPPWPASRAATASPSRSRRWARAVAGGDVSSRGASRNCKSSATRPPAAATLLRLCTECCRVARPRRHAA